MADSTTNINQISPSQAQKEVLANENFDDASPAMLYGRNGATATGLTWGHLGGRVPVNGVMTSIANGTTALTASNTNYVEVDAAGVVTKNTTGFSADKAPLYKIVAGASTITSYEDHRSSMQLRRLFSGRATQAMADANKTLTHAQAMCNAVEVTGALTAARNVVFPTVARTWVLFANTTGGFGVQAKTAAGAGLAVPDGSRWLLECDGVDVFKVG